MKTERLMLNGLSAVIWLPEGETKAVLQVIHGMTEHMGRYDCFAEDLCGCGIAVAGFDLRGHGHNPGNRDIASCGEGGWAASVEDIRNFFVELKRRFPKTPCYMLGFSLGSFLLREYLGIHPDGVSGAIIAGTGHEPGWLLGILMSVVKGECRKAGFDGTTERIKQLSFGTYNRNFKPNRTEADWLCSDVEELDRYHADPLVRKHISAGLFWELLGSMKRTGKAESYASWNREMPVLLLYGTDDPVGKAGKGVMRLYAMMKKAGLVHLECQQFPDARHDIFHETSTGTAENLRHCIADWILAEN